MVFFSPTSSAHALPFLSHLQTFNLLCNCLRRFAWSVLGAAMVVTALFRVAAAPPAAAARCATAGGSSSRSSSSRRHVVARVAADRDLDASKLAQLTKQLSRGAAVLQEEPAPREQSGLTASTSSMEEEYHVADGWRPLPHHLPKDELWDLIREQAREDAASEPSLSSFLHTSIIMHASLEKSLAFLLGNKLSSPTLLSTQLTALFREAYADDPTIVEAAVADLQAVIDRDPACSSHAQCLLYFKGFAAIQCHRVAHWMWLRGRRALAVALQSRISEVFHVDIHPAARLGRGILMDHATGVVIGETAVVGDNVVLLHQVTLGGSGTGKGVRHPNIGNGVLLGAGVVVLGPVSIGRGSKVGARSVVASSMPSHCVAVGVPARVVRKDERLDPVGDMDMISDFIVDYVI